MPPFYYIDKICPSGIMFKDIINSYNPCWKTQIFQSKQPMTK